MGFFLKFVMPVDRPKRVSAFIDGFNLYHAIDNLRLNHLKWLNLFTLCKEFAPEPEFQLTNVYYFSAFATWKPGPYKRHRAYLKALELTGVKAIMGNFKEKDRKCFACGKKWKDHEEKETDVNIAVNLVINAARDSFDRALLVSQDSDLAPAVKVVKSEFPQKEIKIVTPVGLHHSFQLKQAAGSSNCTRMKKIHLERNLFPKELYDPNRRLIVSRPAEYDPPTVTLVEPARD